MAKHGTPRSVIAMGLMGGPWDITARPSGGGSRKGDRTLRGLEPDPRRAWFFHGFEAGKRVHLGQYRRRKKRRKR